MQEGRCRPAIIPVATYPGLTVRTRTRNSKAAPAAGKKQRETRLRRTVGVVRSPSAIPRHRAQPDEQAGTARFESLRRLQKHGNQPSEITFYYLECRLGVPARAILIPEQPHSAQHRIRAGRQKPPQGGTRSRIERVERKDRRPTAVIRNFLKTLDIPSGKLQCPTGTRKRPGCSRAMPEVAPNTSIVGIWPHISMITVY